MPHTQSRYQQDLAFPDARIFVGAQDIQSFGTTTITRDAAGLISYHQGNSQTVQYDINMTSIIARRTGFFEDLQEQFGGAGIPASAQPQLYRPDVIPAMSALQELTPRTAFKQKGIRIKSFDVIYLVSGATMTALTCRVDQSLFVNNVAVATTNILASAANGLTATVQTNPFVINVPIATPTGQFLITPDQLYIIEVAAQTAGGGTFVLYGVDILFDLNFN